MSTSIQVDDETWRRLNQRKAAGDSFDDVVNELLEGISGDAHDRLIWFQRDGESLSDTLDRVMMVLPGPTEFREANVDPERVDEESFVLEHIPNTDGIIEPRVYSDPGTYASGIMEAMEATQE